MATNPTADEALVRQKQDQAIRFLEAADHDAWLLYARDGGDRLTTAMVTGAAPGAQPAAFLFLRGGERIAILHAADARSGAGRYFHKVVSAGSDVDAAIAKTLRELGPSKIGVNFSRTEPSADGISHGTYLRLHDLLATVGFQDRIVSAERLVVHLRAIKTAEELERLRMAVEIAHRAAEDATAFLKPGVTQRQMAEFIRGRALHYGASDMRADLAVNPRGENDRGDRMRPIQPGEVICGDLGATYGHYVSDIKRCWYVLGEDERDIPEILQWQWNVCRATLDVALAATRPGRRGWEVHEEACAHMESLGFRRDGHAMGHQIGRDEQDPGPWLGDRADLQRPADAAIEANMVVTLDPTMNRAGLDNPGGFAMGVEEMATVGQNGAALLFPPQEEIYRVRFSH